MPVTEKEIFVRMCFQFGENHTTRVIFVGKVQTVELEVGELRVTSLLNFTMTKWFVVTAGSLLKVKFHFSSNVA